MQQSLFSNQLSYANEFCKKNVENETDQKLNFKHFDFSFFISNGVQKELNNFTKFYAKTSKQTKKMH